MFRTNIDRQSSPSNELSLPSPVRSFTPPSDELMEPFTVGAQPLSAESLMAVYDDQPLFPPQLLVDLRMSADNQLPNFGVANKRSDGVASDLVLRPLKMGDYDRGYLMLLSQLTEVGDITKEQFVSRFRSMQSRPLAYYVLVVVDRNVDKLVAAATLVLEWKFIHSAGFRGRIEDVVVDGIYRGCQLGKIIIQHLTALGERLGCYKVSLECKDDLVKWYEKFGYKVDGGNNFMVRRFPGGGSTILPPLASGFEKSKV